MKHLFLLALAATLTFASCKEKTAEVTEATADPLYTEVIAMHDEVMPLTAQLSDLKGKLTELKSDDNSRVVLDHIVKLDGADEAMKSWMANFKEPENKAEAQEYLQGEKLKIIEVSIQINGALERGKFLVDSLTVK